MTDDLLERLRRADPAPAGRVEREARALQGLPARISADESVVPSRRLPTGRRIAVAVAAAIVAVGLIVPLALLSPLGRDDDVPGGGTDGDSGWMAVATLQEVRAAGVVYVPDATTFVLALDGDDPYALSAIPLEDPREATRERVVYCEGSQTFLGSVGDTYLVSGVPAGESAERGLAGVALRVVDGIVEVAPDELLPGDGGISGLSSGVPGCETAGGIPLEGRPGFAIPAGTRLPPIAVALPQAGMRLQSPARIVGSANVFEATVSIRILDAAGNLVADTFTTAACGTGCRGDFAAEVELSIDVEQPGTVQVFESSAEDGSMINTVEIPVTLVPLP
jgi:immunoglobulin-like protein involved in spore germination